MSRCWADWKFDFINLKDRLVKLKFFKKELADNLFNKIENKCCIPHDNRFDEGGNIIDYIKANYIFSIDLISILHWTSIYWRLNIFFITFFWLNIFSYKSFNWK